MTRRRTAAAGLNAASLALGFCALVMTYTVWAAWGDPPPVTSSENRPVPPVQLESGVGVAVHGIPGEIHRFSFSTADPWIELQLQKVGGDASLRLLLDEHELLWVDSPASRFDTEPLVWRSDKVGMQTYAVEVHSRVRVDFTLNLQTHGEPTGDRRRQLGALRLSATAADAYRRDTSNWRQKSAALYDKALEAWRGLGELQQQARTLFALGVLRQELGEPEVAREHLEEAQEIYQRLEDPHGQATVLNRLGVLLRQLGLVEAARDAYEGSLSLNQRLGDGCGSARSRLNLGLLEQRGGRPAEAQRLYGQALESCTPEDDPFLAAELLVDMAGTHEALGDLPRAAEGLRRAIPLLRQQERASFLAVALGNLGSMERKLGNYEAALEAFHDGLEVSGEIGDPRRQATLLNSLGHAYLRLGEPRRAVAYLQEALPLRRQAGHRRGEAITLSNLGQAFAELNKLEPARQHYQTSLEVRRDLGDRRGIGVTLHRLAKVEEADDRAEVARGLLPAILEIGRQAGDPRLEGQALLLQAELLLESEGPQPQGQDDILDILRRSRQLLEQATDREFVAANWKATAQAHLRRGDLAAAQGALEQAAEHLEAIRADLHHPDLRSGFLVRQQETYRLAVDVALRRHRADPKGGWQRHALALDERIKARGLLDRVVEAEQRRAEHVAPELAAQRLLLMQQMRGLRSRLNGKRTPWHGDLERRLQQVVSELERVEGKLRQQDPSFRQLSRPKVLDPEAMQALVDDGTLVLQFHLADPVSHLWAIDRHQVQVHALSAKEDLDLKARQLHRLWSEPALRDAGTQRRLAAELGEALLGPVAAQLGGHQRLVLVLDGALHLLPMGALPRPASDGVEPLISDFDVIEIPSLSVVAGLRGRRVSDPGRTKSQALQAQSIVVLADPVFERQDPRWSSRGLEVDAGAGETALEIPMLRREGLKRLPASGDEARAIMNLAPELSTVYTGFEASRQVILDGALRNADIVHFATHGQVDTLEPRLSGLSLAAWDAEGRPLDGHLSLQEVYGLMLPRTQLVVLSGCRTALGNEKPGEGLLSLTRGFLHAGAPQVVASLWTVEDGAGRHLMETFYRQLLHEKVSAPRALRMAQNQLRKETRWQDPYYWGAFVHQGDWR